MIKPAQLYKEEIYRNYALCMYEDDYKYYFGYQGTRIPIIEDNNYERFRFVSLNKNLEVIGMISYDVNHSARSCCNFGIISFDKGNLTFIRDVEQSIYDIFYKYNFDRLDFYCYDGNPALRGYQNFIKSCGGREVGVLKRSNRLMDGKLYDSVLFEILKEDYKPNRRFNNGQKI